MSVLPSLIAALERAGGERLVLRSGETPHVLAGGIRHDLGTTKVSVKALEALTEQILSPEARREFAENNVAVEPLSDAISPIPLVVGTHRSGDQIRIELRRIRPATAAAAPHASASAAATPSPAPETAVAAAARQEPPAPPAPIPVPPADPLRAPSPPADTPPEPEESDWEPLEVPAAAANNAPAQASAEPEQAPVTAAADVVPTAQAEPPAPPAAMAAEPELFPSDDDTVRIARPSWLLKDPALGRTPRESQRPALRDGAEESAAFVDETASEQEQVPVVPGPTKIVPFTAAATTEPMLSPADSRGRSDASALEYWVRQAAHREATALYLRAGHAPVVRARQRVQALADEPLDGAVLEAVTAALAAGEDDWLAVSHGEWAREFDGIGPVTCQAFTDDRGSGLVVHLLSQTSASTLQKDIPRQVRRICEKGEGIVIVSAPDIADVMHMVAAVAEATAQRRAGYLISIEPPNGLGHNITGILVSARRIAGTEQDVAAAIRRAVHEGPDILVIAVASGLIAEEAIRAAKPGCLVIVGAIAPTAPQALEAVLSRVKGEREQELRTSLAASFRCAFGYRALRGSGGGRAIVHDLVVGTADVRTRLESWDLGGVEKLQRSGAGGMRSFDAALAGAVHRGEISLRQAAGFALDRRDLVRMVRQAARERNRAARGRAGDRGPGALRSVAGGATA